MLNEETKLAAKKDSKEGNLLKKQKAGKFPTSTFLIKNI
jgi:hypothetical protein